VVDVDAVLDGGGVGESVGGVVQADGAAVSVGDLVGVDRGQSGEVDDRLDQVVVDRAEVVVDELFGDRALAFPADDPAVAGGQRLDRGVQVQRDRRQQPRPVEQKLRQPRRTRRARWRAG
jgi:hypothetical protein